MTPLERAAKVDALLYDVVVLLCDGPALDQEIFEDINRLRNACAGALARCQFREDRTKAESEAGP